ncbi:hypothetical protein AB1Y20_016063 [Prymnesium parvum]|uniref:Uncharacterized protein n=1 Tax=Prymnesium parvum TaxID=97485 RepID=A0AB34K369_PRYPA
MSTSLQDAEAKITGVENEIEQVKNDIAAEAKITGVENEIEQVKNDIAEAVKKIEEVEKQIGDATTEKEKERLCKKEEQLRKKEEQLRDRLLQLGEEKKAQLLQESEKRQRVEAGLSSLQNTTASSREETELKPYFFGREPPFQGSTNFDMCNGAFGQKVPAGRIFVRPCYALLNDRIWESFKDCTEQHVLQLTGTPGVGKSVFGLLFMIELIQFMKRSLQSDEHEKIRLGGLELDGRIIYEFSRDDRNARPLYYMIDVRKEQIWSLNDWLPTQQERTIFLVKDGPSAFSKACRGHALWISSPRAGSFQTEYSKQDILGGCSRLYMPPWNEEELIRCWRAHCVPVDLISRVIANHEAHPSEDSLTATTAAREACAMLGESNAAPELNAVKEKLQDEMYQVAVLERWAHDLGPVARRVFNPVFGYQKKRLALRALNGADIVKLLHLMSGPPQDTSNFHQSHNIILMEVINDFNDFVCLPGSVTISRELQIKQGEEELKYCDSLLEKINGVSKALVFEPYSHSKLLMGQFTAYELGSSGGQTTLEIDLRDYSRVDVQDVDSPYEVEAMKYYVPQDPCFSVIDAWTHQLMFQMTVSPLKESSAHPIKSASKKFLAIRAASRKQAQDEGILVFVVPRSEITSNEQSTAAQWQPQALVSANGGTPTHDSGPQGGWNRIRQYVLFL